MQVIVDLIEAAWRDVFIEVAVEGDFVANLVFFAVHSSIWQVRQHFALEVIVDIVAQWDLFGVFLLFAVIVCPVDRYRALAKLGGVKDLALFGFCKVGIDAKYLFDVTVFELFIFVAEIFA